MDTQARVVCSNHNTDTFGCHCQQYISLVQDKSRMETAEIGQNKEEPTFKEKFLGVCEKCRFPITLEPLVFFYTLSVGLNEVILALNT